MNELMTRLNRLPPARQALLGSRLKKLIQTKGVVIQVPSLVAVSREGEIRLSYAQERLWFLDQLVPGNPFYNIPAAIRVKGPLDLWAFEASINEIVRRHEALRTRFEVKEGMPVQVIVPELKLTIPVEDLSGLCEEEREAELSRRVKEEAGKPFDLSGGPLSRVTVLRLGEAEQVVMLTMHHIVSDGWSQGVFVRELVTLYEAYRQGQASPLPELTIQYADYAVWQREWLQGEVLEEQLGYWKEKLCGELPVLELPTDHPRPAVQSFKGATLTFELSRGITEALQDQSRKQGATLYMTLLAAFKVLLHRYTGQDDIVVGSPVANRNRAETEGLIGFFVNTLVMRTDLSGDPSFVELLGRVKETALEGYGHQELPFEKLVEELNPRRDMSRNSLFDVSFVLQNMPGAVLIGEELSFSPANTDGVSSKFDLTLFMTQTGQGLYGTLEYSTELFDRSRMERLAGHFRVLLESIVANPERRLSELEILTAAECHQLLKEWNDTGAEYPRDKCIHELFEAQVERSPDATAVIFEDERLTYGELNERANRLAHHLIGLGVGPEVRVGICVERSLEMVVGLLGILKAGGAYVPLDPEYPKQRLGFMLDDAAIGVLLTQQRLLQELPEHSAPTVCLDAGWNQIALEPADNPTSAVCSDNLAYIIYTSGSTGVPKGVCIGHEALGNHMRWMRKEFSIDVIDRILQRTPIAFDASGWEFWLPLMSNASLIISAKTIPNGLWKYRSNVIQGAPSLLRILLDKGELQNSTELRRVFSGGEALARELAERLLFRRDLELVNLYGPTEACIDVTFWRGFKTDGGDLVSIGKPISNTQIYLLDEDMNPVPVGVAGEIYIGGAGLARGYMGRPGQTAEKFIPNPYSKEPGARMYRTGDLGRYREDGNIEFIGRIDHQVKIRGYRIELGEIESVLGRHPGVREAVVVAREDEPGEKRLVGYVVAAEENGPNVSELREYLKEKLPEYMVPAAFVYLDELPLTPNGKVDRRGLPAPGGERPELGQEYVGPRTPIEESLAGIWAEVLRVERVGVHDNFFELGGHSLLATQVMSRVRNIFQIEVPLRQLFEEPTVGGLAERIEAALRGGGGRQVTGSVPLTPIQRWFLEEEVGERNHFNQAVLLEVPAEIDGELLRRALREVLAHHDGLRLRLVEEEGSWRQYNADIGEEPALELVDLSSLEGEARRAAMEERAAGLQASLDLTQGPLLRTALFRLGAEARLLIVIHHMAVDGVSWRILLEDLLSSYEQLARGAKPQLPAKTTSFQAWARSLSEYAKSAELENELNYWRRAIPAQVEKLPTDYPAGANSVASSASEWIELDEEQTRALLQEAPAAYRTQVNDLLLTALAQAFAGWTGERQVLIDLEGHGREDLFGGVDLSRTVGWFTSLFPVLLELPTEHAGPSESLKAIKEQLRAIPQHGIGYGVLRYLSEEGAVQGGQAEVVFNYLGQFDQTVSDSTGYRLARESAGPTQCGLGRRSHLIDINAAVTGGRLRVSWGYSRQLYERSTISRLARSYAESLQALVEHCLRPGTGGFTPSDFPLARLEQRQLDNLVSMITRKSPHG